MNTAQRIGITLAACFCLALPAAAQKNIRSFQQALTRATTPVPLTFKTLKITNLPARPSVQILVDTPPVSKSSVRVVPPRQVRPMLYKSGGREIFVPRDFVGPAKALYRGMAIEDIEELKNILRNGLEVNKTNFKKKIFTAYDPLTAVLYSQPTHRFNPQADLPVLIKIPLTPFLEQYSSVRFETARAFEQNIPAVAISDVWILLEVNQKADWYKAVLEDGEVMLLPAHGRLQDAR